jgi:hypothetical protein
MTFHMKFKSIRTALLSLALLTGLSAQAAANTYYVAKTGGLDSRSCTTSRTESTPKQSINSGLGCLAAGDTLLVKAGTYDEVIQSVPSGTSWSNIVRIANYPGDTVWIKPSVGVNGGGTAGIIWLDCNCHYIEFDGINLDQSLLNGTDGFSAVWYSTNNGNDPHHIRYKNAEIIGCHCTNSSGFSLGAHVPISATGSFEVQHMKIHGGGWANFGAFDGTYYGVYIQGPNNLIEDVEIYDTTTACMQLYSGGGDHTDGNTIRRVFCHDVTKWDGVGSQMWGLVLTGGNNNLIYNNIWANISGNSGAEGRGINIYGGSTDGNKVYNNVVYGVPLHGIDIGAGATNTDLKNNIVYNQGGNALLDNGTGTINTTNMFAGTNPQFVNAAAEDFHLTSGSPAKDAGTSLSGTFTTDYDGIARPQGSAWDIGAFEFSSSTICVTPATGCGSSYSTLQAAVNAASYGNTIKLHAGSTYNESVTLPNKGAGSAYITITTDAASTSLPGANVRLIGSTYSAFMPKLQSSGGGASTIYFAKGANHYKFQFVEFLSVPGTGPNGLGYGFNEMIQFGDASWSFESDEPSDLVVDQCYFHGDPVAGQKHAITANGKNWTVLNSDFRNIHSVGQDSNCIQGHNGHGPFDVENNYLECATENFLIGGGDPGQRTYMRATGTPTTTTASVSTYETGHTLAELRVGQVVAFKTNGGTKVEYATLTSVTGSTGSGSIAWTPALTAAPDVPGDIRAGVISGFNQATSYFRRNFVTKNLAWKDGVLAQVAIGTSSSATGTGSLAAGLYCYKVQAWSPNGYQAIWVNGAASAETCTTLSATGRNTVPYTTVSGATVYRVWRGTSSGNETQWTDSTGTPFVDDGSQTWTTAVIPSATKFAVKNLLELKTAWNIQIDSNIFQYSWKGVDVGFAWWFKSVNQDGACWWCQTKTVTVEKNIIHDVFGWFEINGQETNGTVLPPPLTDFTIRDNLLYGSSDTWGEGASQYAMSIGAHTVNVTVAHNTVVHLGAGLLALEAGSNSSSTVSPLKHANLVFRDNMFRKEFYGIHADVGEGRCAFVAKTSSYTWNYNGLADGFTTNCTDVNGTTASTYPTATGNVYDAATTWQGRFVAYSADGTGADYHIKAAQTGYTGAGSDSKDLGADITAIASATAGVGSGAGSPLSITTATLQTGVRTVAFSQTLTATGGSTPYSWTSSGTLPTGLTLSGAGVYSGTPTAAGTFTWTATVTDSVSATASKTYTATILQPITITTTSPLLTAVTNEAYTVTIAYTGGQAPYVCAKPTGTFPTGITLDASTCTLSGTPTVVGTYSFTISVTGAIGSSATLSASLTVATEASPAGRPSSSGTVPTQRAIFGGTTAPSTATKGCCKRGDLWVNTAPTSPVLMMATAVTSSSVTWTQTAAGGALSGDGSALTNLNASALASGTIPGTVFPAALAITTSVTAPQIFGTSSLSTNGYLEFVASSCSTLSSTGRGRLCFDSTSNTLKISQNGGAYTSLGTAFVSGGNAFGADASLGLTDAFTLNLTTNNVSRVAITSNGNSYFNTTNDAQMALWLETNQTTDRYGWGMPTANGRKFEVHSWEGTLRQALMLADASANTQTYFGVGHSNDSGGTYKCDLCLTQNGVVTVGGAVSYPASSNLASAATIAPTNAVHHITGTTQINTITVPVICGATCTLYFIPNAAFTLGTTGNIGLASTAVANRLMTLVWDGTKWYPSY